MSETPWWYQKAACQGIPAGDIKPSFCNQHCTVKRDCLAYALCVGDWFNHFYMPSLTWGGHSGYERGNVMKQCEFRPREAIKILTQGD